MSAAQAKAEKPKTPKKRGPKGKKTPRLINAILAEFGKSSSISTQKACKNHDLSLSEWMLWLSRDDELSERYARAKELQAEMMAEEILTIADDSSDDEIFIFADTKGGKPAKVTMNAEFVQRSKLRVDARKWVASKLLPKKYGDKINLEHDVSGNLADMMRQHLADSGDSK